MFSRKRLHRQTDQELAAGYRATEDLELLGALYERYLELVNGVCLKYLKDQTRAEDAVMAIFEELVVKVKKHEIRQFRSWLHVLTKNYCLMQLRREQKNLTVPYEPGLMQSVDSRHHTIEPEENGYEENLRTCIEQLPALQKSCIEMFYFEGRSYKEIAAMKKEEVGKVRSYIQNGRRNLKICLEKKVLKEDEE